MYTWIVIQYLEVATRSGLVIIYYFEIENKVLITCANSS